MISKRRLLDWLQSLPKHAGIGVDEGRLRLMCDTDPEDYLEIGGMPDPNEDDYNENSDVTTP